MITKQKPYTEYVVQIGSFTDCDIHWKSKWRYQNKEDAEWMKMYQKVLKGRAVRVVKVETTSPSQDK